MLKTILALVAALATLAGAAQAQTLSLTDALRRAEQSAYPVRIAEADAAAGAGRAKAALGGILPTVRVEASYLRTTDPLSAFGFTLRQRSVTPTAFAPVALNYPEAIGNVGSALVAEVPLFNADAWLGRRAAVAGRDASTAAAAWSRETASYNVTLAYFAAVVATERVTTLDAALAAANAHARQAESLLRNGIVTRSDLLIATVRSGETETMLVAARSEAKLARLRLALAMGAPGDTAWILPAVLPSANRVRAVAAGLVSATSTPGQRADVLAADDANTAATADLARAKSLYLPRVNSFGRVEWNTPSSPFGGQSSWTIGVMASWTPIAGASHIGEVQSAAGRAHSAAAGAEAASAEAQLEQQQAQADLSVALAQLDIAERAVDQGAEAHRIVGRKYDGGLATVVDLFDAAAIDTQTRLAFADARFRVIAAMTAHLRAVGASLDAITPLDQ